MHIFASRFDSQQTFVITLQNSINYQWSELTNLRFIYYTHFKPITDDWIDFYNNRC